MTLRKPSLPFFLLTLGVLFVLFHFHGHVLRTSNSVLLSAEGDGLKNYFTYVWHVAHDEDALTYRGSNHPFGEHVFYTDGNPVLAWVVRMLPFGERYAVGILNLSLLLGLLLCAWVLYALLREFELPPWAAAIGGFSILLLQPQLTRMSGHLSLAHAWMIPLAWWCLLRSLKSTMPWRWTFFGLLVSTIAYLTHPYMGLMIGFFQGSLLALVVISEWRSRWKDVAFLLRGVVLVGLPVLLFLILLNSGAEHADRPASPGGADLYATRFLSLIVPTNAPLGTPLNEFFKYEALEWEARCYLGLSSILMLVVIGAVQIGKWTWRGGLRSRMDLVGLSFAAGFIVLLFAMGEFTGLLGERIPLLKQFRGMGRFAWVFWYACAVFCTVRLYHYLFAVDRSVRRSVATLVFTLVVGLYAVEGWGHQELSSRTTGHGTNVFKEEQLSGPLTDLVIAAREASAVAIIPLPFIHTGSEYYTRDSRPGVMTLNCPLAFHTALPLIAGITSRTSLAETRDHLALLSPPEFRKELGTYFDPADRLLVTWSREKLDDDEREFMARCIPLKETEAGALYTISAAELFHDTRSARLTEFDERHMNWPMCQGLRISENGEAPQGELPCGRVVQGTNNGFVTGEVQDYTTLLQFKEGYFRAGDEYELSFIFHPKGSDAVNLSLVMEHYLPGGKDGIWEDLKTIRSMPMQYNDRTVARLRVRIQHPEKVHKFFLKGPDHNYDTFEVEHILFRPVGFDVWRQGEWYGERTLFFNNIPLIPSEDREGAPSGN